MNRANLILIIALGLAGCKNQAPAVDPFFGRTTVPPPPTGSVSAQTADPYYRSMQPVQGGPLQANAPYNPGGMSPNPTNAPLYSGSNPSGSPNTAVAGPQPAWPNTANPSGAQPGNYSPQYAPGQQYTPAQPASRQSAPGGFAAPGASQYLFPPSNQPAPSSGNTSSPPKNNLNYNYTYPGNAGAAGAQTALSPNRVATPYFAGGAPNRTTLSEPSGNPGMSANSAGVAGVKNQQNYIQPNYNQPGYNQPIYNQNINSYQNNPNPRGNNYLLPASRQSTSPASSQAPGNSSRPVWRESTSSDDRVVDDNVQPASGAEVEDDR
jgi:hypothetical protein